MNKITLSKIFLICSDFITFFCSLFISLFLLSYFDDGHNYFPESQIDNYVIVHLFTALVCVIWFWVRLRHYTYRKPFWFELKEIFRTLLIFFVIELSVIALSKLYTSRTLWILTWSILFISVPFIRICLKKLLISVGWYKKNTVIIGTGKNAKEVYKALNDESYLGFAIHYFIVSDMIAGEEKIDDVTVIDPQGEDLFSILNIDKSSTQFILALDDETSLDYWLRYLTTYQCRSVSIIPNVRGIPLYGTDMSFLFSHEMLLLRVNNNLAKRSSRILKRTMDIIGSLGIIIALSPVLLMLYFIIKKDGGPAIYGHPRIGRNGKIFKCLKFRSMVVNSKEVLEELLARDPEAKAEWEKDFKLKNDPRITKIGAFIRKTSLDELPQLFNVLKGEMSLVGPRPIVKEELERYQSDVDYYLMAKPGMTGLWQVSGRNDVDYDTRVYFDAWYVKNWSLWNDVAILFKTVNVVLNRNGAY
ncbi:undecaprenyl-phosphate galactose phosphotransferase [Pasteurella langaaensis DSM 22999]|uniref:Undecaprenyl-phosphate galactose phosphotransferase n=1 Tax=Alitibacter langaaensis DSM 22999 TaxID=1122935 RepID=A0A2U0THA7_9PAST|nr:undecaprenyl-phosphate galactose phosphotransferase WbaP [Pasteurella langaaensis]PVX42960.1 undecaprenyl-phosphate galactose phosphotransferase [Pasteurella langaaensis DSM 22999]